MKKTMTVKSPYVDQLFNSKQMAERMGSQPVGGFSEKMEKGEKVLVPKFKLKKA